MLYGAQQGPFPPCKPFEAIQIKIFANPFSRGQMCVECDAQKESRSPKSEKLRPWLSILAYQVKCHFSPSSRQTPFVLTDQFRSPWQQAVLRNLAHYGLPLKQLLPLEHTQAKRIIREKVLDIEFQNEVSQILSKLKHKQLILGGKWADT